MKYEEAIESLMNKVDPGEIDEELEAIKEQVSANPGSEWQEKYNTLADKYRTRFKEEIIGGGGETVPPVVETPKPEKLKIEDLPMFKRRK